MKEIERFPLGGSIGATVASKPGFAKYIIGILQTLFAKPNWRKAARV